MIQVRSISCLQWFASAATRLDASSDVAVSLNESAVHGRTVCLSARSSLGFAEAGIRGCCSITAIRRTEFSIAVVQPKKSAMPVGRRQRSGSRRSRRARNFCRILQSGHCRCLSSFAICRSPKLGSSRSTEGVGFLGWRSLEQRKLTYRSSNCPPDTGH